MEINEKLATFVDVFFNESGMCGDQGSYPVRSALTAFAFDLGIIGDNDIIDIIHPQVHFGTIMQYFTTLYQWLTLSRFYYDKDKVLSVLQELEIKETPGKVSSDKEALANNLARLNMVQDQFNRYIMMRAVLTLAKELHIISDETIYKVLSIYPKSYDYYLNLEYYRKRLGIEVPSKEVMEKQSESDHDHQQ